MGKKIIGRIDVARFPELNLHAIAVKIDTGAFTSSMHCHEIKEIVKDGVSKLSFRLLDPEHEEYHDKKFVVEDYDKRWIKNSFGESEERYVISTFIELFQKKHAIDLTLTNRGNMRFPVLLGRKILDDFLVDVSQSNLSFQKSLLIA